MTQQYALSYRIVAFILLLSISLQSCLNLPIPPVIPDGKHQVTNKQGTEKKELIQATTSQHTASHKELIYTVVESKALVVTDSTLQVNQPTPTKTDANTQQSSTVSSTRRRLDSLTAKKNPQQQRNIKIPTPIQLNPIKDQDTKGPTYVFKTSKGQQVKIYQQGEKYQANVKEQIGKFTREHTLPVYFKLGMNVTTLASLDDAIQGQYLHLIPPKPGIQQSGYVYIGKRGLLGGMMEGDQKTKQSIPELDDIEELYDHFYNRYLEITPDNCQQLVEISQKYKPSFENYQGGIFLKAWQKSDEINSLKDLLRCLRKIRKFKIDSGMEDNPSFLKEVIRAIQFYKNLKKLNLDGCQLSDDIIKDMMKSIASKHLKVVKLSANNLSSKIIAAFQAKFPNVQLRVDGELIPSKSNFSPLDSSNINPTNRPDSSVEESTVQIAAPKLGNKKRDGKKELEKGARAGDLLARAKEGDREAQYQLGKKAHDSWGMEKVEERKSAYEKEARKWLGLAATNRDNRAVNLLKILNKHHFVPPAQSTDNDFPRDAKEKEKTCREINNDLPSISYNHQALLAVMKKIPMSQKVEKEAILYLKNIEQKIDEIKSDQLEEHAEYFYYSMKDAILGIHNMARRLYRLTKPYHSTNPNTLRRSILDSIASFEKELKKRLQMSVKEKEALVLKTKRLYAEQSYIYRHGGLQKELMEHLGKIKQLFTEAGEQLPCCYISYAWPSPENQQEEYWVQPFLFILYDHLTAAGIEVIMDIRNNKPGNSIYQFMEQYEDGNHIILVGTESLLQKHRSDVAHAVKTELSIINNRFEEDQKTYGECRIYPLLISGSNKNSFPAIYDKYRTVRDARDGGYVFMVRRLVDWIYEQQISKMETEYKNLWRYFDKNCPGLPKEADIQAIEEELNIGYHQQRLDYLRQDSQFQAVQAQQEASHSPAVAAEMVGVMMKSQGNNPRYLYHEYGQQFQRPSITPNFVERKSLWNRIVVHFEQSEQQILTLAAHGLGGMGKTELAKYYYLCPPRPYELRAWFNAEDKEHLYPQYIDLAKANGIEFEKEMPIEEQARRIKNWLETQKGCLLVYDNVPNDKQLEGLLPEQGKHHILITSRNEVDWPAHQKLDVDVMEEQEAIALICKITGCKEETAKLKKLVKTLGYLPLALAQAGAYITKKKTSVEGYLNRYREHQSFLLNAGTLTGNPKHEAVWVTFDINFKALEVDCPNALTTLKQVSWLSTSAIPELLLETMLEDTQNNPLLWDDVKEHIGHYSLMRIDGEGHQLSMHRLLQDILRSKQDELERKKILNQIVATIKRIYPKNDETVKNIVLVRLLLPHIESTLSHLKKNFNERECADFNLEFNLGNAYQIIGDYVKAKEHFEADLLTKQKKYRGNHPDIATSLNNLGNVYRRLEQHQDALKYHEQSLEMSKTIYPDNHPYIASSLHNIGAVYQDLGQHRAALKYLKHALEMRKALYTGNHPNIAGSLGNIGDVYASLGQKQEALKYAKQALEMRKVLYIGNHPDIATSLNNIGIFYSGVGKNQKALKYLKDALEIYQVLYLSNHPDIATSLHNIGTIYSSLGQDQAALKYHQEALAMRQALYSDNHPDIATSLHNIGGVYQDLGQHQEALKYHQQALAMGQALYSGNHPDIASSLGNMGTVYYSLGQKQEALKYYKQALETFKALYPNNHLYVAGPYYDIDVTASCYNLALVYETLGEQQEALKYYIQTIIMYKALSTIHKG